MRDHIRKLETALVNMMTDNGEYKSEYERIAEEGRLLYTTYASKSNQLKQLAALNVKLQGETTAAKDKESAAVKEAEKERQEAEKWKNKYKDQLERHKDVFGTLEKLKQVRCYFKKKRTNDLKLNSFSLQQHEEDVATIKRLAPATSGAKEMLDKKLQSQEKASVREAEMQKKHRQEVVELESKIAKLKARLDAKGPAPVSVSGEGESSASVGNSNLTFEAEKNAISSLKERVEVLNSANEALRQENKTLVAQAEIAALAGKVEEKI